MLPVRIADVGVNLVQMRRSQRQFIKISLHDLAVVFRVDDEDFLALPQKHIGFHDREQPQRLRIVWPGQIPRHLRCLDLRQIRMMPPIIFQNELLVQPLHVRIVEHRKFVRAVFRRLEHAGQHQLAQSHQQLIILIIAAVLEPRPRNGRWLHDRHTVQKPQHPAQCSLVRTRNRAVAQKEGQRGFQDAVEQVILGQLVKLARHDRPALRPAAHGLRQVDLSAQDRQRIALRHVFPVQSLLNLLRGGFR